MPIITKPASIEKNSPAEISLDKAALAAVSSVVADDYFSDSDNWKEVFIYYKSSTGNQREILKFNATVSSPTANFLVSDKALDIFEVQKIVIMDFDGGSILIPRSQLTVAEFDVDMGGPAPVVSLDFTQGSLPAGASVVSGTAPDMSNASAKFVGESAQINMPVDYLYVAYGSYKVRLYVKSVNQYSGHSVSCALNSLFRTSYYPSMSVNQANPALNLATHVGGYIEYNFTAGYQFNDGFPVILSVQISPRGWVEDYLEITKIEVFEN